jgi:ketol-acid reductoisomerase
MDELLADISSGRFADEWEAESRGDYARLKELIAEHAGPGIQAFEDHVRKELGSGRP